MLFRESMHPFGRKVMSWKGIIFRFINQRFIIIPFIAFSRSGKYFVLSTGNLRPYIDNLYLHGLFNIYPFSFLCFNSIDSIFVSNWAGIACNGWFAINIGQGYAQRATLFGIDTELHELSF